MARPKVLAVIGTRPEAVKMAPVILALRADETLDCRVVNTGQHRDLAGRALETFGLVADVDLDLMQPDQEPIDLVARMLPPLDRLLAEERPAWVVAQGDTTTVLAAALAARYRRVPFAHVEAGLRTHDRFSPFPEETNRILADRLAHRHFAPTARARENLLAEGMGAETILVTGNTVIDALRTLPPEKTPAPVGVPDGSRLLLVTAHRRESFGAPLEEVCEAIAEIASRHEDVFVLYPVHPNPAVRRTADRVLAGKPRVSLRPPMDYPQFVGAMRAAYLILTDSGGVQEEAPSLGKPVLVLRNETERPEAVEAGSAKLVGLRGETILRETERLLGDRSAYRRMSTATNAFGDGHAAERICAALVGRCATPFAAATQTVCDSEPPRRWRRKLRTKARADRRNDQQKRRNPRNRKFRR